MSELEDEFNEIMKAIGKKPNLIAVQEAADELLHHSTSHVYTGPAIAGDHIDGWPMSVLLGRLSSPSMKIAVGAELKRRTGMGGGAIGVWAPPPVLQAVERSGRPFTLEERMAARMHWGTFGGNNNKWAPGFQHMAVHQAGDKIFVWVITKEGEAITLEDEAGIFPSDAMVTKLHLLEKT